MQGERGLPAGVDAAQGQRWFCSQRGLGAQRCNGLESEKWQTSPPGYEMARGEHAGLTSYDLFALLYDDSRWFWMNRATCERVRVGQAHMPHFVQGALSVSSCRLLLGIHTGVAVSSSLDFVSRLEHSAVLLCFALPNMPDFHLSAPTTSIFKTDIFAGKVLFCTGGASGICYAQTLALMRHGADAAIFGRRAELSKKSAKELSDATGRKCLGLSGDVRKPETLEAAVKETIREFGRIDYVIAGAAGNFLSPVSCAALPSLT